MVSWLAPDPKRGLLWILQRGPAAAPIIAVDASGAVLHAFGQGSFKIPHAIQLDAQGHVWTVDAGSSRVIEWTADGRQLLSFVVPEELSAPRQGDFKGATDIAFGSAGQIFVSDGYQNARVLQVAGDGRLVHAWGSPGSGPGEFNLPHALATDAEGTIYVADRENGRIEHFDAEGQLLGQITGLGRVYAIALAPKENALWASVQLFRDPPGSAGWLLKLNRVTGATLGYIALPEPGGLHAIAVDSEGQPLTDLRDHVLRFHTKQDQPAR